MLPSTVREDLGSLVELYDHSEETRLHNAGAEPSRVTSTLWTVVRAIVERGFTLADAADALEPAPTIAAGANRKTPTSSTLMCSVAGHGNC